MLFRAPTTASKCRALFLPQPVSPFSGRFICCSFPNSWVDVMGNQGSVLRVKQLNWLFEAGRLTDAQKLFDTMTERNVITWTVMIHGYAKSGLYVESIRLFSEMQLSKVVPNSFTMVAVLVGLGGTEDIHLLQSVHGRIVKTGFESDLYAGTTLLDTYARCGSAEVSFELFKEMGTPSIVSFNAMLSGFVKNHLFHKTIRLFNELRDFGLRPNSVTMLSVVQACAEIDSLKLCECVHGYVSKVGLDMSLNLANCILDMYLSLGFWESAICLFETMVYKDVISWTTMIGFLVCNEYSIDALDMFSQMRDCGIQPDKVTMINIVSACALLADLSKGRAIHNRIVICGFSLDVSVMNTVISMYSKCDDLGSAIKVFDSITEKSLVSWSALISGYVQNGNPIEALASLRRMRSEAKLVLDYTIMVSSIVACGELASLELCCQLHGYTFAAGFLSHISVQNSFVASYAKCGDVKRASKIFEEMTIRDLVSWNSIIYGYGINGDGKGAVACFHAMKKIGEVPDSITYLGVLHACSHSGLVDDGLKIFNRMVVDEAIEVKAEHCGCVADMLARSGCLEEANNFGASMPEEAEPNVWRAILGGCGVYGNIRLAETARRRLLDCKQLESGNLALMSNLYKSAGMFQDSEYLRSNMDMKQLLKEKGTSLLGVMSHDFRQLLCPELDF